MFLRGHFRHGQLFYGPYLHRPGTSVSLTKAHLNQYFPHWWHLPICFKRMGSFSMGGKDGTGTGDSRSVGMNFWQVGGESCLTLYMKGRGTGVAIIIVHSLNHREQETKQKRQQKENKQKKNKIKNRTWAKKKQNKTMKKISNKNVSAEQNFKKWIENKIVSAQTLRFCLEKLILCKLCVLS